MAGNVIVLPVMNVPDVLVQILFVYLLPAHRAAHLTQIFVSMLFLQMALVRHFGMGLEFTMFTLEL